MLMRCSDVCIPTKPNTEHCAIVVVVVEREHAAVMYEHKNTIYGLLMQYFVRLWQFLIPL